MRQKHYLSFLQTKNDASDTHKMNASFMQICVHYEQNLALKRIINTNKLQLAGMF